MATQVRSHKAQKVLDEYPGHSLTDDALFLQSGHYVIYKQVEALPGKIRVYASAYGMEHNRLCADHVARGVNQFLRAINLISATAA